MDPRIFVCMVALFSLAASDSKITENEHIQRYLTELKKSDYNKNVMPVGNSQFGPVEVRCEMYLLDISKVDDLNMDYRAMFYFRQIWNDSRLVFSNQPIDSITLNDPSLIWTPDLFFIEEKEGMHHSLVVPNTFIKIYTTGEVRYSVRLSMTFRCPMDFTKYPHDVQKCQFNVESYKYKRNQMALSWNLPISFSNNINLTNFALKEVKESVKHEVYNSGDYTTLRISLVFQRKTGFFMIRLYAPFMVLVAISWLCFWIPAKMLALRLPLLLVILYLMVQIETEINDKSPPVSYNKGSDIWIAVCESLVFASFLETIVVHIFYRKKEKDTCKNDPEGQTVLEMDEKMNRVKDISSINLIASRLKWGGSVHSRIDRISAFLFPSLFVIFNFIYGLIYCCGRQ